MTEKAGAFGAQRSHLYHPDMGQSLMFCILGFPIYRQNSVMCILGFLVAFVEECAYLVQKLSTRQHGTLLREVATTHIFSIIVFLIYYDSPISQQHPRHFAQHPKHAELEGGLTRFHSTH